MYIHAHIHTNLRYFSVLLSMCTFRTKNRIWFKLPDFVAQAHYCYFLSKDLALFILDAILHQKLYSSDSTLHEHIRDMEVHCNTLQHTTPHCNTLYHTTPHCNTLHHTTPHCNTLQYTASHTFDRHCINTFAIVGCIAVRCTATHCNALHRTALHCIALHCTASHCNALHHSASPCTALLQTHLIGLCKNIFEIWMYNTLQHGATHCNALQHCATQCNTLLHTHMIRLRINTFYEGATNCNAL